MMGMADDLGLVFQRMELWLSLDQVWPFHLLFGAMFAVCRVSKDNCESGGTSSKRRCERLIGLDRASV